MNTVIKNKISGTEERKKKLNVDDGGRIHERFAWSPNPNHWAPAVLKFMFPNKA